MIACVIIPYFAAAGARRFNPALATLPLLLGEPPQAPERVYAVSPEAAQAGVKPGMPLREAQLLCPQATLIPAQLSQDQVVFDEVLAVLADFTSLIEPDQSGQVASTYLDLGHLAGSEAIQLIKEIGRMIRQQTGLAPTLGLASGKFPAQVAATSVTPNRASVIAPGHEATFLAPRSIGLLPLDAELAHRFHLLGLRTLGQLAALPAGAILVQFGKYGYWLHQLARGRDHRSIQPRRPSVMERVTRQLDGPVSDWTVLIALSQALATELADRLQASGRVGRELHLRLHLENGVEWTEQFVLRQATAQAERLGYSLDILLRKSQLRQGVVAMTISLADLKAAGGQQLELFTLDGGVDQANRLRQLLPDLVARHGGSCFYHTAVTNPLAYLPESRFQLWSVQGL